MRRIATPLLILAIALSVVSSAAGQWDNRNAATWYRKVVELFGWEYEYNTTFPDSERLLSDEEYNLIGDYQLGVSGEPSPELRHALAKAKPVIDLVRRGSQQHYSDFQLDYSQGFALLLPHLSTLRQASRVIYADAEVRLHDGDIGGATDRIASLYRMSGHIGSDRIIISSLVGAAAFEYIDRVTQKAIDRGDLTAFESAILVNSLRTLDQSDPFNYIEAVAGEQVIAVDWMAQRFPTQEDRQALYDEWGGFFGDEEFDRAFVAMTDDEFATSIELYDQYMGKVTEAFMLEDPEAGKAALAQLREEAEAGEYGLFGLSFSPAFDMILDRMHRTRAHLLRRLEELEKIAQGQVKPEEYANAAVFYERGIRLLREIDPSSLQAVIEYQKGEVEELSEEMLQTLTDAESVVDLFREGSEKHRCDFSYLRPYPTDQFCPEYVGGMRDGLRIILADAMRRLDAGEQEDAVIDRLAICHRAVAHLTGDELILSAMVAHDAFNDAHVLGVRMEVADKLTDERKHTLLKAVERIGRKDPFGYVSSIIATREYLSRRLRNLPEKSDEEESKPTRESAQTAIKGLNGDQLLTLTAARDTVIHARAAERIAAHQAQEASTSDAEVNEEPEEKPHPLTRLEGIIDFESLVEVRDEAEAISARFDEGRIGEIFTEAGPPPVAPVVRWMSRARADLRECIIRLRPPMAVPQVPAEPPD